MSRDVEEARLASAHTDWLHHELAISGPVEEVAAFRAAALGASAIPWHLDLDAEEARLLAPMATQGAEARGLARALRHAVGAHHERVLDQVRRARACPLNLHRLVPVPDAVLRLGPDDPASERWLRAHWAPCRHCATSGCSTRARTAAAPAPPGWCWSSTPPTGARGRPCCASAATGLASCSISGRTTAMPERAGSGEVAGSGEGGAGQGTGDALWDDWDTPLRAAVTPLLHLDGYEGPMELLLDLAGRQRIDLGRLSILGLIEQFLAELGGRLCQVAIERRADWVVVASRLVLLRSRLLAPASPEVAAAAQRDADAELRRLEAAAQVRAAAAWLQARPQLGHDVFARPGRGPDPRTASYMALMQACLVVLRGSKAQPIDEPVYLPRKPALWSVAQAMARIRAVLEQAPGGGELASFLPKISRAEPDHALRIRGAIASTLMAGLELARDGELVLKQEAAFSAIELGTAAL